MTFEHVVSRWPAIDARQNLLTLDEADVIADADAQAELLMSRAGLTTD